MSAAETSLAFAGRSCLYECRVMHQRFVPKVHRFEYGIFMLAVDLAELAGLSRRLRLFGHNRRRPYEFRDADHLIAGAATADLRAQLTHWLGAQGVAVPADARILLVTLPRVFGYIFAPVSFYFLHTAAGDPLGAVAEVQNTFGELKPYWVPVQQLSPAAADGCGDGRFHVVVPKKFYVSPFSSLELSFDFQLRMPGERLAITVKDVSADQTVLLSTLTGIRRPLTDGTLAWLTLKYPLVTLRVVTLIHWQALKLWWRRLPWHSKSDQPENQQGVYRPHPTIHGARLTGALATRSPARTTSDSGVAFQSVPARLVDDIATRSK